MLFVRGLPLTMERAELVELLNDKHARVFDFVFMPPDMKFSGNKGFFFINFRKKECIDDFRKAFQEKKVAECFPKFVPVEGDEEKLCSVEPANLDLVECAICRMQTSPPKQGVDRTKWQPLLFSPDGEQLAFPLIVSPGARQPRTPKATKTPKAAPTASDAPSEGAQNESQPEAPAAAPEAAAETEGATPKAKGKKGSKGKDKDKGAGKGKGTGSLALGMDMYSPFGFFGLPPSPFGMMPGLPPMSPMEMPSYASPSHGNKKSKGKGKGAVNAAGAGGDPSKFSAEGKKNSLMKQVDFYFSADNLCKDVFLRQNMDPDGYCKLELIANFNLVKKKYMASVADLAKAVVDSTSVELSDDKTNVRLRDHEARQKWRLLPEGETGSLTVETAA